MNRLVPLCILLLAPCLANVSLGAVSAADERYQQWAEALVPPCCWQGSLKNHDSEPAQQAKRELREMIDQGYPDQQIRDEFVARYGAAVLMTPDGRSGQWLFTMPAAFLFVSAFAAVWLLRRMLRRAPAPRIASAAHIEIDDDDLDW